MKKKIMKSTILMILIVVLGFIVSSMASAESYEGYKYVLLNDGTIKITGYSGEESDIIIPSEIEGVSVTEIGNSAFCGNSLIEKVIIPDSVIKIGKFSFEDCKKLKEVTIHEGVTYIGAAAFRNCENLNAIVIPDSLKRISGYTFYGCSSLTEVSIGKNVERIGSDSFANCISLIEVVIPNKVKEIGEEAFWCCEALESVVIGESVIDIEYAAFASCTNLENVTLNNNLQVIGEDAFAACNMTDIIIPESVRQIGDSAFEACKKLETIIIPDTVTSIGFDAFTETLYYKTQDNWDNNVLYIGNHLIKVYEYLSGELAIKESTLVIADGALMRNNLEYILIPDSVTHIGRYAIMGDFESLEIPNSVVSIGEGNFIECSNLESIIIPDSVKNIGPYVLRGSKYYYDASNWEDGVLYVGNHAICVDEDLFGACIIKEGTINIASGALMSCSEVTSVSIPKSIENIGSAWVFDSTDIEYFYVDENNRFFTSEEGVLFTKDKTKLISYPLAKKDPIYVCPNELKEIQYAAFSSSSTYLKTVILNDGIEFVDEWAFGGLDALYIPSSLKKLSNSAVENIGAIFYGGSVEKFVDMLSSPYANEIYFGEYIKDSHFDSVDAKSKYDITNEDFAENISIYCESVYYPAVQAGNCKEDGKTLGIYVSFLDYWAFAPEIIEGKHLYNNSERYCDVCNEALILTSGSCGESCSYILYGDGILEVEGTGAIAESFYSLLDEYFIKVRSSIIHEGITEIGDEVFAELTFMKTIEIPESVIRIGEGAFAYCYSLSDVSIGESVDSIGVGAFLDCVFLDNVYLYTKDAEIGFGAFCLSSIGCDETKIDPKEFWNKFLLYLEHMENGAWDLAEEIINEIGEYAVEYENGHVQENTVLHCYEDSTADEYIEELSNIGFQINYKYFEKHIHNLETVTIPATCTLPGMEYTICTAPECNGGIIGETSVLPASGHTSTTIVIPATCTATGMQYNICSNIGCGISLGESKVLEKASHTPGEWEVVAEATYEAEGKKVIRCAVCKIILEEEVIPKLIKPVAVDEKTGIEIEYDGDYDGEVDIDVKETFDGSAFNIVDKEKSGMETKVFDISMLLDGKTVQPNGKVTVRIPVPKGFNPDECKVYYVNLMTGKVEEISSYCENGYIIFETDHFSYYAIVDESSKIEKPSEPETPDEPDVPCTCKCHKGGIAGFFWKIANFFNKLFKIKSKQMCACGVAHY